MSEILIIPPTITAATIQQSLKVRLRPVIQCCLITAPADHISHEGKMLTDHSEEELELVRVKKMERKG